MPTRFEQAHDMSSDGPRAVLDELGAPARGHGQDIWLVDLAAGTVTTVATAPAGYVAWAPDISGDRIVWTEWLYADAASWSGSLSWRVRGLDLASGTSTTIAHGTNTRLVSNNGTGGLQAVPPLAQVDGDTVAYTLEDPTPARPDGWKIIIASLPDGHVERSVTTAQAIYSLALANGAVAYSEGRLDLPGSFTYATRLMLSTADRPTPREIAKDTFTVVMAGDRLAWVSDPMASQGQIGLAQSPQILTAAIGSPTPTPASVTPDGVAEKGAYWPAAGDGFVSWADDQDTGPGRHPDPNGDHLVVWSERSGEAVQLEPTAGMIVTGVGGGWLTWYNDWKSPTIFVAGIPIAAAGLP
jgi:hypothetical protein